MPAYKGSLVPF
ncbi:hypothetical protein CGLO_00743 [Colletotrichum gloeosporioides Cg-14]|uniref:Uncharacterized protein n=1 Tax=Colletotrichum gloeosporioides (strain Cg-14) TaxID=1237896 RepID=T0M678_COLGC|nr:hypothetical protein CGLO_00743 [Colletotrichum gloeosporioides Cg-14]